MNTLSAQFAQAIVDNYVAESNMSCYYCTFCGKRHKSVLHKGTGFFVNIPQHTEDCVVVLAQSYLGLDKPHN